jgi:DivIVA domain-containing protein
MAAFAPEEIESRRFVSAIRGYDREEVDAFLRAVADDIRRDRADAKTRLDADGEPHLLIRLLVALQEAARVQSQRALADAYRDAERVRASARHEAQAVVVHARCLRARLLAESAGAVGAAVRAETDELAATWWRRADQQLDEALEHLGELQETLLSARDGTDRRAQDVAYPVSSVALPPSSSTSGTLS